MSRPLKIDSSTIANFQMDGDTSEEVFDDILSNLPGTKFNRSITPEFYGALSEFVVGVEDRRFNGINPRINSDDRDKFLTAWRGFMLGDESKMNLKDSAKSDLSPFVENSDEIPQIAGLPVDEVVERTGNYLADTYTERDRSIVENKYLTRKNAVFQDRLGLKDDDVLRVPKLGEPDEVDEVEAAVRLIGSDAEKAEIIYPLVPGKNGLEWGQINSITEDEAREKVESDSIDELVDRTLGPVEESMEKIAETLEQKTGLKRADMDPRDYIETVYYSELDSVILEEDIVPDAVVEAGNESKNATDINNQASKKISDLTGIVPPHDTDPIDFMDAVAESEGSLRNFNLNAAAREALLDVERGTDEWGLRVYRRGDSEAYSVTTIIDPFPNGYDEWNEEKKSEFPFHKEIDTGGGLFYWKNIYDGAGGKYDSDIITEYAGTRGTLAHEEVFENYVDDPEKVKGNTEKYWKDLEELEASEDDLGPLKDIIDWKGDDEFEVLEYDENPSGFASNGRELAEKEISWVEEKFEDLEQDLGLSKDRVIAAEKEFVHTAQHPVDGDETVSYGGTVDMIYEDEDGENVLLDLKTGSLKPNYVVQSAAYKEAVENSGSFEIDNIDRVVIPSIDPETMMYDDREPVIYSDKPHESPKYNNERFLDASNIDLESSEYRENRWRPENWDEEAFYIFARAAEEMEKAST